VFTSTETNIFEVQQSFVEADSTLTEPFTNIFNRGYKVTLNAYTYGKQRVVQPRFAKSDSVFNNKEVVGLFNTKEVLGSAAIRSGNK
jgi:hypothetical protein